MNGDPLPRFAYGDHIFGSSELNVAASSAIEGLPDEQRTSPIRRTFLLFILFEFVIIIAFWLLYIRTLGDFSKAMADQVIHMQFNTTLFDVQIISVCRFSFLEVAYGAFHTSRRWPSATWTAITTLYMLAKCMVFATSQRGDPLAYTDLILPIVMTWISTLILECRVLPQERRAKRIVNTYQHFNSDFLSAVDTQSAYLGSVQQWLGRAATARGIPSIYGSPEGSLALDAEFPSTSRKYTALDANDATVDVAALLTRAEDLHQTAWSIYEDTVWSESDASISMLTGSHITSANIAAFGEQTVFRMDAVLHARPKTIFDDLVYGFEFSHIWNSSISSARILQTFPHEELDIVHTTLKEALGGLIKPRDFVMMRAWGVKDDIYYVTASSVTHPKCPPVNDCVRADQLINSFFLRPSGNLCHLTIITCFDLKGWLSRHVISRGAKASLNNLYKDLQNRAVTLDADVGSSQDAFRLPVLEEAC
nr:StAR lipid transfer protein 3 [Hymenolepis microstoma]